MCCSALWGQQERCQGGQGILDVATCALCVVQPLSEVHVHSLGFLGVELRLSLLADGQGAQGRQEEARGAQTLYVAVYH